MSEVTRNNEFILGGLMESQGLIICFQIIVHTHTHTHKLIQRQENTKKRVETQYTQLQQPCKRPPIYT